ncbi:MAG: hypothetical protein GXN93_01980, partial [Candidatus Diapherotrites archaeon]|nr:hypothetical protein [Candidatus Diapherotrites archaeon]
MKNEHPIFRRIRRDKKLTEIGYYTPPSDRIFTDLEGTARLLAQEKNAKDVLDVFERWYAAYRPVILGEKWRGRKPYERSILPPP